MAAINGSGAFASTDRLGGLSGAWPSMKAGAARGRAARCIDRVLVVCILPRARHSNAVLSDGVEALQRAVHLSVVQLH